MLHQVIFYIFGMFALKGTIVENVCSIQSVVGFQKRPQMKCLMSVLMDRKDLAEIVLILFGIFLIIDSLFLHWLFLIYPGPISFLDPFINHWQIGFLFVCIGVYGLWPE